MEAQIDVFEFFLFDGFFECVLASRPWSFFFKALLDVNLPNTLPTCSHNASKTYKASQRRLKPLSRSFQDAKISSKLPNQRDPNQFFFETFREPQRTSENLQRTFREPSENLFFTFLVAENLQRTHAGTREPGSGNFAGWTRAP